MRALKIVVLVFFSFFPALTASGNDVEIQFGEDLMNRFAQAVLAEAEVAGGPGERTFVADTAPHGRATLASALRWKIEGARFEAHTSGVRLKGRLTATVIWKLVRNQGMTHTQVAQALQSANQSSRLQVRAFDLPVTFSAAGTTVKIAVNPTFVQIDAGPGTALVRVQPSRYFDCIFPLAVERQLIAGVSLSPQVSDITVSPLEHALRARFNVKF